MIDFKDERITKYINNIKIPKLEISYSTNEDLQNKDFNKWLSLETIKFLEWYNNEGITGRTFYSRIDFISSYSSRLRGKFIECLMVRYLEFHSGLLNLHQGLADYFTESPQGNILVEIKTQDYYDDNAGVIIPLTDFKGVDLTSLNKAYVLDVEFNRSTNNVAFASLINLNQTTVIEDHKYQQLGIKKINLHLQSNKHTLLVQTKEQKSLHAVGGKKWTVPYENNN